MPSRRTSPAPAALADLPADGDARRVLLADWCRLIGQRLEGVDPAVRPPADPGPGDALDQTVASLDLPPRVGQTLLRLLAGRSEKQIALDLCVSPHTVHTYVKHLHKRLNVSSRGELLARFVHPRG